VEPAVAPHVIRLLAWDKLANRAARVLARSAPSLTGQLADALLDPEEEFAIRRRVPRVLAASASPRAAAPLLQGLQDRRFEVRFQCGRALARLQERGVDFRADRETVNAMVLNEVSVDRRVWQRQRLLDELDDAESVFVDEVLRNRADRSLEHVFTLLSLTLPREPLLVAFRGLHTSDRQLRGTALEYLESVLPPRVRDSLWPFLEAPHGGKKPGGERSREAILESLLESSESIRIDLEDVRRRLGEQREAKPPEETG
jgi:hypothetical protein